MSNVLKMAAVGGAVSAETDPNFNQTVLLLHGDGTNGAQNNTFLDSSSNNFTITRNPTNGPNAPTQGTFSPFSVGAGEWSNFFDGTTDWLRVPDSSVFTLTNDFTIECWFYQTGSLTNYRTLFNKWAANNQEFIVLLDSSAKISFGWGAYNANATTSPLLVTSSNAYTLNSWNHLAIVRSSNTFTMYLNGVSVASASFSTGASDLTEPVYIGAYSDGSWSFQGNISNARIVKGRAVYTSAFTPPTSPLGATSGGTNPPQGTETSLLTCQSNRFVDNSTANSGTGFAITRNGDVRVTPFSPFAPSAAYDPAVNGGSGYFDGTGDWLNFTGVNAAFQFGTGDWTIEFWVHPVGGAGGEIIDFRPTFNGAFPTVGMAVGGKFVYTANAAVRITGTTTVMVGAWYHVAVTRSGTSTRMFVNGVQEGVTYSDGTNYTVASDRPRIGADSFFATPNALINAHLSNLRIIKGTAVYTSAFTPPTALLTAITNTSLLLNYTNAGILDNTGKNNLETVGNAQVDTTTKKFGTGSMEFDGTGDWLLMPNTPDQQLGTGNFTIELWVYLATGDIGSARGLVAKGTSTTGLLVSLDSSEKVVFTYTTSTITSSGAITTNAWNHIAVVREGTGSNQTKIYINGTNDGTGTVSTDFNQTSVMYVGANRTGGDPMKGFIDDLRITKGVARYTANFTAPTKEFPDQ